MMMMMMMMMMTCDERFRCGDESNDGRREEVVKDIYQTAMSKDGKWSSVATTTTN